MKLIHKFKSPNFDKRDNTSINYIIIHYTALESEFESIAHLCSKKNRVSSHYLISKHGKIYILVSEKNRAWHAGQSYWKNLTDINSNSIGIELDYLPDGRNQNFSKKLMNTLVALLKILVKKYQIPPENILGHSDVAPYRKQDPGKNFPWYFLEKYNLAFKIRRLKNIKENRNLIKKWFVKNNFYSQKKIILFMLNYIGYDISLATNNKNDFDRLISNYSNRHRFYKNYFYNKKHIFNVIEFHFLNIVLTKYQK